MVLLALSSLIVILLFIGLFCGGKYAELCMPLDSGDFPLKSLYTFGYAISIGVPVLRMPKKLYSATRKSASLLYGEICADFYTSAAWAGFLTLSLILNACVMLIGAFIGEIEVFFIIICAALTYAIWNMLVARIGDLLKRRQSECEDEFPNAVNKLALLINSGMVLRDAWKLTSKNNRGQLYALMRQTVTMMDNGASDVEALYRFGVLSNSQEIKKFAGAVIQSIEKGGGNLTEYLLEQTSALLQYKKQELLRKGEIAAGKLIAPIGIMFIGVMLIIAVAALQSMSF